jgi:hypothetical protein
LYGVVTAAIQTCQALSLPCCTAAQIRELEVRLSQGEPLAFGTDLILAAWLIRSRTNEADYEQWERKIIGQLLADIIE